VSARDDVLTRVRNALGSGVAVPDVPRGYRGPRVEDGVVDRFCERVAEYRATVTRIAPADLADTVARLCRERGATRIAVPGGWDVVPDTLAGVEVVVDDSPRGPQVLPGVEVVVDDSPRGPQVLPGVEVVVDDPPLSPHALDALDGVLTGCALAIAETGTIVLDGGERSGRRALTLVPDWHVCVVEPGSIVAGVPDAVAALAEAAAEGRPITLVSGPSATSDIELDRVEGVHGPRTLDVLVLRA
jgi:L-lactate dehydrogenase complex protein LldG